MVRLYHSLMNNRPGARGVAAWLRAGDHRAGLHDRDEYRRKIMELDGLR
jgi:hypothetical protein